MKKRWFFYLLVGVMFGVFDFFFQTWVYQLFPMGTHSITMLVLILGVWLVLVVPIAIHEGKTTGSVWPAAASSAFTWSVSVVAYYLFMGVNLIFIGLASRPEMHISNLNDPNYWINIKNFLVGDLLSSIREWIIVALVGGGLVGLIIGFVTERGKRTSIFSNSK